MALHDDISNWVQCERCSKWRLVPTSAFPLPYIWTCQLNPDVKYKNCQVPEEEAEEVQEVVGDGCFFVERLLDVRRQPQKGKMYRTRWAGFSEADDSWEPEANIDPELIKEFEARRNDALNMNKRPPPGIDNHNDNPEHLKKAQRSQFRTTGAGGSETGASCAEAHALGMMTSVDNEQDTKELRKLVKEIKSCGGSATMVQGWSARIKSRVKGNYEGSYDVYFFSPEGGRFRSRAEVARFFGLHLDRKRHIKQDVWVMCDDCTKWRRLPPGSVAPAEDVIWRCTMSADIAHNSCLTAEEADHPSGSSGQQLEPSSVSRAGPLVESVSRAEPLVETFAANPLGNHATAAAAVAAPTAPTARQLALAVTKQPAGRSAAEQSDKSSLQLSTAASNARVRVGLSFQSTLLPVSDSVKPYPSPPPSCYCGSDAVWARQRWFCERELSDGGCTFELVPPPLPLSPCCECGSQARWAPMLRRWCCVRFGAEDGCHFELHEQTPNEPTPFSAADDEATAAQHQHECTGPAAQFERELQAKLSNHIARARTGAYKVFTWCPLRQQSHTLKPS